MINTFYDSKSKEKEGNIIYKKIYDKSETFNVEDQYKVSVKDLIHEAEMSNLVVFQ